LTVKSFPRPSTSNRFSAARSSPRKGYDHETGNAVLARGDADLVAFGKLFIANPDLPLRFRIGAPLNPPHEQSFYGGDARGYIDYPALETETAADDIRYPETGMAAVNR
jgi:2,4-dienoyl-CoA reductase-like NADH-dependent reductase (Old Yellow Enzyme family)